MAIPNQPEYTFDAYLTIEREPERFIRLDRPAWATSRHDYRARAPSPNEVQYIALKPM
jgi:hypothetical protein